MLLKVDPSLLIRGLVLGRVDNVQGGWRCSEKCLKKACYSDVGRLESVNDLFLL